MTQFLLLLTSLSLIGATAGAIPPERFYASRTFQDSAPGAFVIQPDADAYIEALASLTANDSDQLLSLIKSRPALLADLQALPSLGTGRFRQALQEVHELEIGLFGIHPRLIFDDQYPRAAYFQFNTQDANDAGTIILNLTKPEMEKNRFSALSLLIHETRHAFQLALSRHQIERFGTDRIGESFLKAFQAQENLKGFSFLDFCSLTNELEAFQFANRLIGLLTGFSADDVSLGSYASQFRSDGSLKIDLTRLHQKPHEVLYTEFNRLEEAQLIELNRP